MTPGANDLCVFAVKRGNIEGRFDVRNLLYSQTIVRHDYQKATLGSLTSEEPCYGTSATAIKRTDESQPKYIRITDFDDFGIEANHEFMTAESYSDKHFLKEGDILFARTGATVGKTYYYDGSIGEAIFAGYCIRFRFDPNKVLPKFVYWMTKTNAYEKWVQGIQRPSGQPNINKEEYKSLEVPLPEMNKQKQLSIFLEKAIQTYRTKKNNAYLLLSRETGRTFKEYGIDISSPKYNKTTCVAVTIGELLSNSSIGVEYYHPERMYAINAIRRNVETKAIRIEELVDFCRNNTSASGKEDKYLGLAGIENNTGELSGDTESASGEAFEYQRGDVLYARLRPYLNKVRLAEEDGICSKEFHVMRVKDQDEILPAYLAAVMRTDVILAQTKHMMTGNTHPRISNEDVKNLCIPIPGIDVQRRIVNELENNRKRARRLMAEADIEWADAKAQFERELLGES